MVLKTERILDCFKRNDPQGLKSCLQKFCLGNPSVRKDVAV